MAGASDFPHSRQDDLDRDVINPQNGHILCDAKPRAGGVNDANSLEKDAVIVASRLRKRSRNRRKARSISDPPSFFLPCTDGFVMRQLAGVLFEEGLPFRISATLTMTRRGQLFCARLLTPKIAHTWEKRWRMSAREGLRCQVSGLGREIGFPLRPASSPSAKVSYRDQYPPARCAIIALETSTSSLSFRFSELSQPI